MIKTYEEIMESIKQRLGDDSSDEALTFIEDISDTLKAGQTDKTSEAEDWKKKYEDNDKMWREKYRDRFFNAEADKDFKATEPKTETPPENDEPELATTFDQLFGEKK